MSTRIYDCSMPLRDGMPLYPGNPPFQRVLTREIARGDVANESRVEFGTHCGTHVDAPRHFLADGAALDALALESLVGPARLFDLPHAARIDRADLEPLPWRGVERVLFKTRNSRHWQRGGGFDPDFVHLTGAAAAFLVEQRLKLVGVDGLSIERHGSAEHPVHRTLLAAGIPIVEGLCLADVPAGEYTLFCGPLRLADADGSPARVFLVAHEA